MDEVVPTVNWPVNTKFVAAGVQTRRSVEEVRTTVCPKAAVTVTEQLVLVRWMPSSVGCGSFTRPRRMPLPKLVTQISFASYGLKNTRVGKRNGYPPSWVKTGDAARRLLQSDLGFWENRGDSHHNSSSPRNPRASQRRRARYSSDGEADNRGRPWWIGGRFGLGFQERTRVSLKSDLLAKRKIKRRSDPSGIFGSLWLTCSK